MLMRSTLILTLLLASSVAMAQDGSSRVMQLAKRVAAMENSRDLPSRAVWLSNRVIKNSRDLAYVRSKPAKKKRPQTSKN